MPVTFFYCQTASFLLFSSTSKTRRQPPYWLLRASQHRLRNRSLARRFSISFLSGPGKDLMFSEAEFMLIATRVGVGRAHMASEKPQRTDRLSSLAKDGWDAVYVDEGQRRLVYSGTLHLALAALWFYQDVEEMVKEACQKFSGLPETVVRLWHAELAAHRWEPSGNDQELEEEEECVDADTPMENKHSQDIPPFRFTRDPGNAVR
ncbi:hypothetical protein BDZ89DRAFT_1074993 [Hymenopellis radicata]|nr:hypothetical protein BDZ89DRAFT_1074993 [Hymenopellis radicata]